MMMSDDNDEWWCDDDDSMIMISDDDNDDDDDYLNQSHGSSLKFSGMSLGDVMKAGLDILQKKFLIMLWKVFEQKMSFHHLPISFLLKMPNFVLIFLGIFC